MEVNSTAGALGVEDYQALSPGPESHEGTVIEKKQETGLIPSAQLNHDEIVALKETYLAQQVDVVTLFEDEYVVVTTNPQDRHGILMSAKMTNEFYPVVEASVKPHNKCWFVPITLICMACLGTATIAMTRSIDIVACIQAAFLYPIMYFTHYESFKWWLISFSLLAAGPITESFFLKNDFAISYQDNGNVLALVPNMLAYFPCAMVLQHQMGLVLKFNKIVNAEVNHLLEETRIRKSMKLFFCYFSAIHSLINAISSSFMPLQIYTIIVCVVATLVSVAVSFFSHADDVEQILISVYRGSVPVLVCLIPTFMMFNTVMKAKDRFLDYCVASGQAIDENLMLIDLYMNVRILGVKVDTIVYGTILTSVVSCITALASIV